MPFLPRIAIVGGGPSGLALARLLKQQGIRPTVYELRSKLTAQELATPSGMLDLHEESGLKVMHESGLWNDFQAALGDCSEACRVYDVKGNLLHSDEGELSSRPEIPRNSLTSILLENVPSDWINWNHKVESVQSTSNDISGAAEITLDFGANGTATCDFVVGADGAWSRVRKMLSDVKPFYSGVQYVQATLRNASTNFPHLVELNGSGTLMALGGRNGIFTHRGPQDSIRIYASVSTPHVDWAKVAGLQGKTTAEIKSTLLSDDELFGKFAPPLQDLIATACDEQTKDNPGTVADILPLYMLPVGSRWEHRASATLIGDAAHLMTPFAGEGVNLALWDSLDLAHVLSNVPEAEDAASWQTALEPRLREFEETMLARAKEKAEETLHFKEMLLSENGGQKFADLFKMYADSAAAGDSPHKT